MCNAVSNYKHSRYGDICWIAYITPHENSVGIRAFGTVLR